MLQNYPKNFTKLMKLISVLYLRFISIIIREKDELYVLKHINLSPTLSAVQHTHHIQYYISHHVINGHILVTEASAPPILFNCILKTCFENILKVYSKKYYIHSQNLFQKLCYRKLVHKYISCLMKILENILKIL